MSKAHCTAALLVTAAILASCDSPTNVGNAVDATPGAAVAEMKKLGSAAGEGIAQLPPGFSPLEFSFKAKLEADGSASGKFRQFYESTAGTVDFEGEVTCVSFDPVNHRAWIGGVVTENNSTDPAARTSNREVGDDVWFRVVDNGEGKSPEDRTTVFGFEPGPGGIITSAEYCARQLWTANDVNTWPVIRGNIQVKE
jgi:hypothetical protein